MSHGGTQIAVAVISVVGVVSAALIANYDKLTGGPAPAAAPAVQPSPAATPTPAPSPTPPAEKVQALSDAQGEVLGESTAVLDRIATQIRDSASADISGGWRDAEGYVYSVSQQGEAYAYQQYQNGVLVSGGQGQISGRTLRHGFTSIYGAGECVGQVSADGAAIEGMCGDGSSSWPFRITR